MNESTTPARRVSLAGKRLVAVFISRVRRAFGSLLQLILHDQLGDLSRQTQRLSSASVESVTYLGSELRALDERLSRIEEELAALRKEIGPTGTGSSSVEHSDQVASGSRSG